MIRYFFYALIFLILILIRNYLDKEGIFITSDGEVKFYQSFGHLENGYSSYECIHLAKDVDPDFKHHIFDYPFAFFEKFQKSKCVFQYPPLFSILGSFIMKLFNLQAALYFPIILYLLCILVFDRILVNLKVEPVIIAISTFLSFTISVFPITILDYSEMSFYNLFSLLCIFLLLKILNETNLKKIGIYFFYLGGLILFTFFIRSEIALLAILITLLLLFYLRKTLFIWKFLFFAAIGGSIVLAIFIIFNIWSVEYPLGMRTFTVLNDTTDATRTGFIYHLKIAIAFLWGDEEMVGLLKAFPICLIGLYFLQPKKISTYPIFIKIMLITGYSYLILGSLSSPTRGGVQNFGLRYLETGLLPLLLGIIYASNEFLKTKSKNFKLIFLFLILISVYPSYKFVAEGVKTLIVNSNHYYKMMNYFSKVENSYVIHDSINSQYLVGTSFIKQKHLYIGSDSEMKEFEKVFYNNSVEKFMIISFQGKPYISINVPQYLYPKIHSKLNFVPDYYEKENEEVFFDFKMSYYKRKNGILK